MRLPSSQLMKTGSTDTHNGGRVDTALVCYTIVGNRYDTSMTDAEKRECAEAFMHLWSIYYYRFYDYAKCFECLAHARDIADEAGFVMPSIDLGFGCMYQTISEENDNRELGFKALHYYLKCLQSSIDIGDDEHADMACTDVLAMSFALDRIDSVSTVWQRYVKLPENNRTKILRRYNKLFFQSIFYNAKGQHDQALKILEQQLALIEHTDYFRLIYFTYIERAKIQARKGDYHAAIRELREPERIAKQFEMKDCKLETFRLLADYYAHTGDKQQFNLFRERYFLLKDTLTNYRQLSSVNEMEFQQELKIIDAQMTNMRQHRKIQNLIIILGVIILTVILGFLIVVRRQNHRLRRSYRDLYRKNVALLQVEEDQRNNRKKYVNSTLNDNDKGMLLLRIKNVMENSEELFSPDFSIERLAQLIDSKYKYVSQVIHEEYDCNFNTYLNDYRIKEACKRISDMEHYGNLTIEAIGNSVGFKSRSTFVSSFKRVTGLTPSEYQKQDRNEKTNKGRNTSDF